MPIWNIYLYFRVSIWHIEISFINWSEKTWNSVFEQYFIRKINWPLSVCLSQASLHRYDEDINEEESNNERRSHVEKARTNQNIIEAPEDNEQATQQDEGKQPLF